MVLITDLDADSSQVRAAVCAAVLRAGLESASAEGRMTKAFVCTDHPMLGGNQW